MSRDGGNPEGQVVEQPRQKWQEVKIDQGLPQSGDMFKNLVNPATPKIGVQDMGDYSRFIKKPTTETTPPPRKPIDRTSIKQTHGPEAARLTAQRLQELGDSPKVVGQWEGFPGAKQKVENPQPIETTNLSARIEEASSKEKSVNNTPALVYYPGTDSYDEIRRFDPNIQDSKQQWQPVLLPENLSDNAIIRVPTKGDDLYFTRISDQQTLAQAEKSLIANASLTEAKPHIFFTRMSQYDIQRVQFSQATIIDINKI